ncbi:ankyrin repeat domain-containing protein [Alteraurantiacibacter aquimixticola]|uniref:Ankyrin repeat domain-containing protein n=1 Tax=Alteraurantiacibacter aquimixticola TaxID=2489173 RepID=A0A4T3F4M2_9SPHN|nr:ankyrin repeat domain-containing protein [Alteraurantiacibacter aquimixticola]TIX49653.1 ankyrin repeat domain-containing protein [Alteraurantiacibacter aquimixticola]
MAPLRTILRTGILTGLAGLSIGLAMPAAAQLYSDGYEFLQAVEKKDGTKVTELLDAPGSTVVNARDLSTGRSAMHIVVARRDGTWIDFLYQQGANVNIADNDGMTPLMLATQLGYVEGVEKLIAHGARVDVTNSSGETPLMYAVHGRNTELMRVLLQAGADPDRYDNSGRSARDYARLRGANDVTNGTITRYERPEGERASSGTTYGPSF